MTTTIEKSVEINAPLDAAYEFWANVADYPRFMPQLQAVEQVDDSHWRWRSDLNGKSVAWDVEFTENLPGESIGWQTSSKGHRSSTTVRFAPLADGRTAVTFTAHYPNGAGQGVSAADLAHQAEDNLARFTDLLLGRAPAEAEQADADRVNADAEPEVPEPAHESHAADQASSDEPADAPTHGPQADESPSRQHFDRATTWPFGQAGRTVPHPTSSRRYTADTADTDTQDGDQSTTDVLGPAYSVRQPHSHAFVDAWRAQAEAADTSAWLRGTGLARSLDALVAANPLLPLNAPRSVLQTAWFSSVFQMMTWPLSLMRRFSQDADRQLDRFVLGARDDAKGPPAVAAQADGAWSPEIDVDQTEQGLTVRADLPGVAYDDDVEVEVRDGHLVISGEVRHPVYADGHEPASDGSNGRFVRAIPLPEGVDAQGAQASLHDGVLEITLAGPAQRQRRIEVSHSQHQH